MRAAFIEIRAIREITVLEAEFNPAPETDEETYDFIQELFQFARADDAERPGKFFANGLVPNLRADKGSSLAPVVIKYRIMITAYERSDIIHMMKMNRLALNDSDTAQLSFHGQVKGKDYQVTILIIEDLPKIFIKQNGVTLFDGMMKSVDDLKIFLEERMYKYLEV